MVTKEVLFLLGLAVSQQGKCIFKHFLFLFYAVNKGPVPRLEICQKKLHDQTFWPKILHTKNAIFAYNKTAWISILCLLKSNWMCKLSMFLGKITNGECKLTRYMGKFPTSFQIMKRNTLFSGTKWHRWNKFYTSADRDGGDKLQVYIFHFYFVFKYCSGFQFFLEQLLLLLC